MTTRCLISTLLLLPCLVVPTGCAGVSRIVGSGHLVETERDISGFTGVSAEHSFDVTVTQAFDYSVVLTCDDNVEQFLVVRKSGDTLVLGLKPGRSYTDATLRAEVTMPQCETLELSGSARAVVTGFASSRPLDISLSGSSVLALTDMEAGDVEADLAGSSDLHGSLVGSDVDFNLSGSSGIQLVGSADKLRLDGSGSSSVGAESLFVHDADINLSGSSHASVAVDRRLSVDLSGSSSVVYFGEARLTDVSLSGSSTVEQG